MKNFMVIDNNYEDKTQTDFDDYQIGEKLRFNSNSEMKCIDIKEVDGERLFMFQEGRKVFVYD